jgi:hypothetical protein
MVTVLSTTRVTDGTDVRCLIEPGEVVTFHSPELLLADPESFALRTAIRLMIAKIGGPR